MQVVAWDTETALIRPAKLAPELVCVTWQRPGVEPKIAHHTDVEHRLRDWLASDALLVGHNIAFDMAVICQRFPALRPLVFAAYDADRVTDTLIRQWLLDIAAGVYRGRIVGKGQWVENRYGLADLAKRCADILLLKDGWRLSYANFIDTPLDRWTQRALEVQAAALPRVAALAARIAEADTATAKALAAERDGLVEMINGDPTRCATYPLDDARATLAVYQAQERHAAYLADQFNQTRAYFALHLSSAWGLRTDAHGVESLRVYTQGEYDTVKEELLTASLVREDGTRDTKAAKARMIRVCAEEGITLRRTKGHEDDEAKCFDAAGAPVPPGDPACAEHVCLDGDACDSTEDPILVAYANFSKLGKVLSNDIQALLRGVEYPIHTHYGMAETGRATSSKPNIQNWGRKGGARETFIPRPGKVFFAADYPQLELFTLAQCCVSWFGASKLADVLNAGCDPHLELAAKILGISYGVAEQRQTAGDREIEDVRHLAKQANFGLPGGLGIEKFEKLVRKNLPDKGRTAGVVARLEINAERLEELKEQWQLAFPEMRAHFARVRDLCNTDDGRASVETLFTKRHRGGVFYCAAANNGFQALGADCMKRAMWMVCRAQYAEPASPLWNTRTVAMIHDELVGEADEATAHEAATALGDLMAAGANHFLPNVPIPRAKIKPVLMRRLSKDAKPVFDARGRLVPWTP